MTYLLKLHHGTGLMSIDHRLSEVRQDLNRSHSDVTDVMRVPRVPGYPTFPENLEPFPFEPLQRSLIQALLAMDLAVSQAGYGIFITCGTSDWS